MRLQRKGNLKKARIEIILHDRYDLFSAGLLYDLNALHVASLSLRAGSKKPLGRRIMETLHFLDSSSRRRYHWPGDFHHVFPRCGAYV